MVVGFRLCIALENCRIEQVKAKRGTHNDKQGGRDHAKLWTAAEQLKDGSGRDDGQDHPANRIGLGTSGGTSAFVSATGDEAAGGDDGAADTSVVDLSLELPLPPSSDIESTTLLLPFI